MGVRQWFRQFTFFSLPEQRGILVMVALIGILMAVMAGWKLLEQTGEASQEELDKQARIQAAYKLFCDSLHRPIQQPTRIPVQARQSEPLHPSPFDPNTADSARLCQMGLPAWMARNIVHYRSKGGRFRKKEDFRKIYGLTEEQYQTLAPYICIAPTKEEPVVQESLILRTPPSDSIYKYPVGTVVDLNRADTAELKKIPGIGSGIARMIAGYRKQLGGFYSVEQLQDIHLDSRRLQEWFHIDDRLIQRIDLNSCSVRRLSSHPYISFYQAKVIVEHRNRYGDIKSLKELSLYEEFSPQELERLSHYVCFGQASQQEE